MTEMMLITIMMTEIMLITIVMTKMMIIVMIICDNYSADSRNLTLFQQYCNYLSLNMMMITLKMMVIVMIMKLDYSFSCN